MEMKLGEYLRKRQKIIFVCFLGPKLLTSPLRCFHKSRMQLRKKNKIIHVRTELEFGLCDFLSANRRIL